MRHPLQPKAASVPQWVAAIGYGLAGIMLTNSLPHLLIMLSGRRNITPFGRNSSAAVNGLWGALNFGAGYLLLRTIDRRRHTTAADKTWLLPYGIGAVCWSLFGVGYSLLTRKRS